MDDSVARTTAIELFGKNILVSASAGSGKTFTMMKKIEQMVAGLSANLDNRVIKIENLVIVTFTKAVARELKAKVTNTLMSQIQKAFGQKYDELREQIENLPLANISTIHSFCSNILRQHFNEANLDPAFTLLEDGSSKIYLQRAINKVIVEAKNKEEDKIKNLYFALEDKLEDEIRNIYEFVRAREDSINYLKKGITEIYEYSFNENPMVKRYILMLHKRFMHYIEKYESCINIIAPIEKSEKRVEFFQDKISTLKLALRKNTLVEIVDTIREMFLGKIPSLKSDDNEKLIKIGTDFNTAVKKDIKNIIEVYDENIDSIDKFETQDREILNYLLELVIKVHDEYSQKKEEDNVLDFNDLEQKMVELLKNEDICEQIREKFEFVFVDEYQDINPLQEVILSKISKENNRFMVGDIKQSIYGFRQSDSRIFLEKLKQYTHGEEEGEPIYFNKNFRSEEDILKFVNSVFNNLMSEGFGGVDYERDAQLITDKLPQEGISSEIKIAILNKPKSEIEISIPDDKVYSVKEHKNTVTETENSQALYVVREINKIVGKKYIQVKENDESYKRLVKYSDICILSRSGIGKIPDILKAISDYNIPIDTSGLVSKGKNSEVQLLISLLRVIDNQRQDIELLKVLLSVFGNFTEDDLLKIRRIDDKQEKFEYFYQAFYAYDKDDEIKKKIDCFVEQIREYRFKSKFVTVDKLLNQIIADKAFDEYVLSLDDGETKLSCVRQFVAGLNGKAYNVSLSKFLYTFKESESIGETSSVSQNSNNCVRTATIHASKGLEYPIVFLIGCESSHKDNGKSVFLNKEFGIAIKSINEDKTLKGNIYTEIMSKISNVVEKEELMRLLYVALTRAENSLYIVGQDDKFDPEAEALTDKIYEEDGSTFLDWIENVCCINKDFCQKYLDKSANEVLEEGSVFAALKADKVDYNILEDANELYFKIKESMDYKYPYMDSTNRKVSYSVTELNKTSHELNNYKYVAVKNDETSNTTIEGIAYHKVMELIDFNDVYTKDDVKFQIEEMLKSKNLTLEQYNIVDPENIYECVNNPLFKKIKDNNCLRETEFKIRVKANEILDVDIEDKIMVQGVIDLFIPKSDINDENILVDFKYSKSNEEKIKKTYQKQIDLYTKALEICRGQKVDRKYIYVLGQNKVIEF